MDWLSLIWTHLLPFVIVLGSVVLFHEFGHYICAKLMRITVEVFSIGFGPKIAGFSRNGTEYRIAWIPLGGYVKLKGETPEETDAQPDPGDLLSRPRWQRFLVFVMGAVFNLITALVFMTAVYMIGTQEVAFMYEPPVIGIIDPNSPATEADILPGDRVISFEGRPIATWKDLDMAILLSPGRTGTLVLDRDGEPVTTSLRVEEGSRNMGRQSLFPNTSVMVGAVEPGSPAEGAGFMPGDRVVSIDGVEMTNLASIFETIGGAPGREIEVVLERGDEIIETRAIPRDEDGRGKVGFSPTYPTVVRSYPFVQAVQQSFKKNLENLLLVFDVFGRLFRRELSIKTFSGPIDIILISGAAAREGIVPLLHLIAFISLQLGIINLLPIPPLDGGHLFTITIEGVIRRDLPIRLKERVMQAGFLLLLIFMGTVIFFDITKNIPH